MLENIVEYEIKGKGKLSLYLDEVPTIEESLEDIFGVLVAFHPRYSLGHPTDINPRDYTSWDGMYKGIEKRKNAFAIMPVYLYDHSGLTIRTYPFECRWDSAQVGWIYADKDMVRQEYNKKRLSKKLRKEVRQRLAQSVDAVDKILRGMIVEARYQDDSGDIVCTYVDLEDRDNMLLDLVEISNEELANGLIQKVLNN